MAETMTQASIRLNADTKNLKSGLDKSGNYITSFEKKIEKQRKDSLNKQIKNTEDIYKREVKSTQNKYRKLLSEARQNGKDTNKIWKKFAKDRENIERKTADNIARIRKKTEKMGGGAGGGAGALGGMAGKLGIAGGIAGGVALLKNAKQALDEAGAAYGAYEDKLAAIKTLTSENINVIGASAKDTALKYGVSVNDLLDSVYFGFSAGTIKSADDVASFTEQIAQLSKAVKISAGEATQAVSSLVNQTGAGFQEASDVIAQVMKEGVIKSGQELSQYAS